MLRQAIAVMSGRLARRQNPFKGRGAFLRRLKDFDSILEIGPFDKPVARSFASSHARVSYCDFLSTEELRERARAIPGRSPEGVPNIDYVTKTGLRDIPDRFDCVVSIHTIEHVPDLIGHIREVRDLLNPGGAYVVVAPDKRYCFPHFLPESGFPEIVAAHIEGRTRPTLRSVIEHRAFTAMDYMVANDPWSHPTDATRRGIEHAAAEFAASAYVDVHCWQFTPASFRRVIDGLVRMGYIPAPQLSCEQLDSEFGVDLRWE